MHIDPALTRTLRQELADWRTWLARAVVLAYAAAAGATIVVFTWMTERAANAFALLHGRAWWLPLVWTPLCAAAIVGASRRYAPGAGGSGIPQVMAAADGTVRPAERALFVSLRLSAAKMLLTAWGVLAGLSLGREGPSVQIAAGVMHDARRWMPQRSAISDHGLLVAGGAAGIAAAFNTPLAGVMFAIEELSRRPEQRSSGLLVAAIVLAGVIAVSAHGNASYFGVIRVGDLGWSLVAPAVLLAVVCGLAGGLFARLLIVSLGALPGRLGRWRGDHPMRFAAACGLAVALIGLVTQGATLGSGYGATRALLDGSHGATGLYAPLKLIATWLTAWSGVPGGIFAPALAIGAGLGSDIARLTGSADGTALIALGMAGFLAAATQAPLTAFIIVMEMVDGHAMVLSLMACALVASLVSRLWTPPLYGRLAQLQLARVGSGVVTSPATGSAAGVESAPTTEPVHASVTLDGVHTEASHAPPHP